MPQTVTPYLLYEDADAAIDFLTRAFGFRETSRTTGQAGGTPAPRARGRVANPSYGAAAYGLPTQIRCFSPRMYNRPSLTAGVASTVSFSSLCASSSCLSGRAA